MVCAQCGGDWRSFGCWPGGGGVALCCRPRRRRLESSWRRHRLWQKRFRYHGCRRRRTTTREEELMNTIEKDATGDPFSDAVTAEVIRSAMETICFEMATYVSRTATTPILNQSNERNATILDAQGRLAALSVGIPQFMLTSTLPVRFALEFLGPDEFREGDVFVANDPYHGGGHLPDYNVFAPVFAEAPSTNGDRAGRRMVLIASIQCHHTDTGGAVPGGYNVTATDIWGEGVRWPVVKVVDRGVVRRDVLYALQANNRLPDYIGDLRAQIGSAQLGVQRLSQILDHHGTPTVEEAVDYMIDYAARRFREEVTEWPDGVYEADAYVDHDPLGNPDVHLHVKITVDGDTLTIDYSGSDSRPELQ